MILDGLHWNLSPPVTYRLVNNMLKIHVIRLCVFDRIMKYSAGPPPANQTKPCILSPCVNNSDEWVCLEGNHCNHGDRRGHWHGDAARPRPGTPRIPWCDLWQEILDASVIGHCIYCCIMQTGKETERNEVGFCVCRCVCERRWVIVLATVRMCSDYTHCGRETEGDVEKRGRDVLLWSRNKTVK